MPDELVEQMHQGPRQVLFNAIFSTLRDTGKKNEYGYFATDSELTSFKIWALASNWESLITREMTAMQTVLGLIIHRETASKEGIRYLHKCNHSISYNAIRKQNEAWARMASKKRIAPPHFVRALPPTAPLITMMGGRKL